MSPLLVSFLVALQARAEEPTAVQKETARSLMETGAACLAHADPRGAVTAFAAADALVHTPTTGYELGAAEARIGRLVEARSRLLEVARSERRADEPAIFEGARTKSTHLSDDLFERIPTLRIRLQGKTSEPIQELVVDSSTSIPPPAIEAPLRVDPGDHELSLRVGLRVLRLSVHVAERETHDVVFDVSPVVAARPPTPRPSSPPASAPNSRTLARVFVFSGFGVAVAGLAAGATTGFLAIHDESTLSSACLSDRCTGSSANELRTAHTLANVSTGTLVVAGAATVVGIVAVLLGGARRETTSLLDAFGGAVRF